MGDVADSEAETEDDEERKRPGLGEFLALLILSPSERSSVGNVGIGLGLLTGYLQIAHFFLVLFGFLKYRLRKDTRPVAIIERAKTTAALCYSCSPRHEAMDLINTGIGVYLAKAPLVWNGRRNQG